MYNDIICLDISMTKYHVLPKQGNYKVLNYLKNGNY